jgi:predicted MPP superfamily phosphohydrolase
MEELLIINFIFLTYLLLNFDSYLTDNKEYMNRLDYWRTIYMRTVKQYNLDKDYPIDRDGWLKYNYNKDGYSLFSNDFFKNNIFDKVIRIYQEQTDMNNWDIKRFSSDENVDIFYSFFEERTFWKHNPCFVQKIEINSSSQISIIGDIHSAFHSVIDIIVDIHDKEFFITNTLKLSENKYIIFTGDFVNKGPYSIEVLTLIFNLKIINPNNVFLINGNHEDRNTYLHHDFEYEMTAQGIDSNMIDKLFNFLPSALFIKFDNKIYQFCHGVMDHKYGGFNDDMSDIPSRLNEFLDNDKMYDLVIGESDDVLTNNFKWGDFNMKIDGIVPTKKDGVNEYGIGIVKKYLNKNKIECILSGHQDSINFGIMTLSEFHNDKYMFFNEDIHHIYPIYLFIMDSDTNKQDTLELNENILGVVTSTATVAKKLNNSCYLILNK